MGLTATDSKILLAFFLNKRDFLSLSRLSSFFYPLSRDEKTGLIRNRGWYLKILVRAQVQIVHICACWSSYYEYCQYPVEAGFETSLLPISAIHITLKITFHDHGSFLFLVLIEWEYISYRQFGCEAVMHISLI